MLDLQMRADLLVSLKLEISRSQALELIKNEKILINEILCKKPSQICDKSAKVDVLDELFVGRGALKLRGFLQKSSLNLQNLEVLDVGSSTGGFVEILLNYGVKSVVALDVGTAQLHKKLLNDKRVKVLENTDIRDFGGAKFDLVTCDVSFISLLQILPKIYELTKSDAILLFKPQFEVGKEAKRDKNGVVKDKKAIANAMANFLQKASSLGFKLVLFNECEILGKRGNLEYFYHFKRD